ncbi:MAG: DinB family protein [Acidobacteria bacterium]|nr:DinB family protein [Acidobacteriota bacterium]
MGERQELNPELQGYFDRVEEIRQEAGRLVDGLSEAQSAWQPAPNRWSIAQCLEHLNATARNYFPLVNNTINNARSSGLLSAGPYRHGWLGRLYAGLVPPPPKLRVPSPRRFTPPPDRPMSEIWPSFLNFQDRLQELIVHANGVDLGRATVPSPVNGLIKISLGSTLAIIVGHEQRHLWQARQIHEAEGFPK